VVPSGPFHEILAGEFGVVTMTVTYVLGLLFPLVVGFYAFLAIMEDTGYLPRLAVLVDRALSGIGLNGRAVIPLIIGFGCVTMATITTRLLGTQREKTIATAILGLTIPCSAQLGVILGLLSKTGSWTAWATYCATMFVVLVAVGTILDRVIPGQSSPLLIDLPPLRLPQWKNVARKTWSKSWGFLVEATPLFALGALIVGVMKVTGALEVVINGLSPAVTGLLHLPREAATCFIMGLIRRDFGAAGLTDLPLSPSQMVVSLVVITLFVPCIATVTVLFKERGWKEAMTLWMGSWVLAFAIGGVLAAFLVR
jgi:ferrous iron transport protein B